MWGRNPPQSCLPTCMLATSNPLGDMLHNVRMTLSSSDMGSLFETYPTHALSSSL